jgi:dihydrodiol dehydrogenase / D-xylose 1-dehydrogenase (NADP)
METAIKGNEFAQGLSWLSDAELVAIGSRTVESAQRFGEQYSVPYRHGSYQALADDVEVDIVNPLHKEHSLLCLESGRAR